MANTEDKNIKRLEIFPHFEGVNSLVADNISKKGELQYAENARADTIGTIEKRFGTRRLGATLSNTTANHGLFFFDSSNASSSNIYRVSTVSGTVSIYYLNTSSVWTALTGGGVGLAAADSTTALAEGCCFFVNGSDANRYISTNGTTVVTSASTSGHLYNSPEANKINYYKDRLYVADFDVGSTNYRNAIMRSSTPLGIVGLVDGDHAAAVTELKVTDLKYIRKTDSLDIYRGNSKIETITVSGKSAKTSTLTVSSTSNAIKSSDELWVAGTYSGTRMFRWADNPESGVDVKAYDTFKMSGGQDDRIKMMTNIADLMIMANNYNMAVWNDYNLKNYDFGIGCVSDNGYVKALGTLWFIHYTGIYSTIGERPKLMSAKIEKYIEGATRAGLEAATAGRKGLSVFFTIGDVTLYHPDGSVKKELVDVCLEYNMRTENWYVHTGIDATHFTTYIGATDTDRLEFASNGSGFHVYEFLVGTQDDAVTTDKEILFRIDSPNITLSREFEKICYPMELVVETERGSNLQCFVSLDNARYYQLRGDFIRGCVVLKITNRDATRTEPPRCRQIKVSIRDYSKSICKVSRIALVYKETLEEEEQNLGKNE